MNERELIFEMLAMLSYLRAIGRLPEDFDFTKLEGEAKAFLEIEEKLPLPFDPEYLPQAPPQITALADRQVPTLRRSCPSCGDDMQPKIVHLKVRPPMLGCLNCGHQYKLAGMWV